MKTLITYFSAEHGTTAKVAKDLAEAIGADLFEIRPEKPYSAADMKWVNPLARCNKEKLGKKDVPVAGRIGNFDEYESILVGFPIWYGSAPNVVNTFCKGYDWSGKKIAVFATSGGSGIGRSAEKLEPFCKGGEVTGGIRVTEAAEVKAWLAQKGWI